MSKLFSQAQIDKIDAVAKKSQQTLAPPSATKTRSINADLKEMSQNVIDYFQDSPAILITSVQELHEYIDKLIEAGYAGIDTETTGLDRVNDTIVGASLYYPGGVECYIPMKHLIPIFEEPYKNQLTYEEVGAEFQRIADSNVRLIFANADYDLSMIYKDLKVDFNDSCYYDVILAWRCLKENERDNTLKGLYNKYCLKGRGDPKKFSDFFTVKLFPYCKPDVAKLYAANDAKITYELFKFQLPYVTEGNPKCARAHLESIARLIWDVEIPLIKICQNMHRTGMYCDKDISAQLIKRYEAKLAEAEKDLQDMVQEIIEKTDSSLAAKRPFKTGKDFNPNSPIHTKYLIYTMMKVPSGRDGQGTGKDVLADLNLPVTNQILKVRSILVLINTFVKKLPAATTPDSRIHAQFKQVGADCVVADTILPTTEGYYTIGQICEGVALEEGTHHDVDDLNIVNMNQAVEKAQSVIRFTDYPTIKITTEYGFEIEGTYNHPVLTESKDARDNWEARKFTRLDDITLNDYIEIPCNYNAGGDDLPLQPTLLDYVDSCSSSDENAVLPLEWNEALAEFAGIFTACGYSYFVEGEYRIGFNTASEYVIDELRRLVQNLFHMSICVDSYASQCYIAKEELYSLEFLGALGTSSSAIPEMLWTSPVNVINAYIRGLSVGGDVYRRTDNTVYATLPKLNSFDSRFIHCHLASQGILGARFKCTNSTRDEYIISFDTAAFVAFRDKIGYVQPEKRLDFELDEWNIPKYRNTFGEKSFKVKVIKIEESRNTVYDLHVPETHSFISNGMISHNTGRMSSAEPHSCKRGWARKIKLTQGRATA